MYVRPWEVVLGISGVVNAQEQAFVADLLGSVEVHRADECRQVRIFVVKTTPVHVRQVDVGFVPFSGEGYRLRYQVVAPYPHPKRTSWGSGSFGSVVAEMVIPSLTVLFSSSDRSLANRRA